PGIFELDGRRAAGRLGGGRRGRRRIHQGRRVLDFRKRTVIIRRREIGVEDDDRGQVKRGFALGDADRGLGGGRGLGFRFSGRRGGRVRRLKGGRGWGDRFDGQRVIRCSGCG